MRRIAVAWFPIPPERGGARTALLLTSPLPAPPGFAIVRHADAAAAAQEGHCSCCRVPSGIASVLRQLFLDRVRGVAEFDDVIVAANDLSTVDEAMSDPLVAARYEYCGTLPPR